MGQESQIIQAVGARLLSKKSRKDLFLILAAPIHFWAVLMFFLNFPISISRVWTAIGLLSYTVLIAFADSLILFVVMFLIGISLPTRWTEEKKLLFLTNLGFTVLLGLVFAQFLDSSPLNPGQMWGIVGLITLMFLAFFEYFSLTKKAIGEIHLNFFYRLLPLSYIFMGIDGLGFVIVVLRNIFWIKLG